MERDLKPFITLMKKCNRTKYDEFLMNNRIIMQCYNINIDSDNGMHYMLFIPYTDEYMDSFYDETLIIRPDEILKLYKEGHDKVNLRKKSDNIKPKFISETFNFYKSKNGAKLVMKFKLIDEVIWSNSIDLEYPVNENSSMVENCVNTIDEMLHRIKPCGIAIVIDALRSMLVDTAQEYGQIYFKKVKVNGLKIRIPLFKSLFLGIKDPDSCIISIQESLIDQIFIYSIQMTSDGITEQQFGYIVNF